MRTKNLSGAEKIALQFLTLLQVISCVLFILLLSAINSYNVSLSHQDWEFGRVRVTVHIVDKLTDGSLAFGLASEFFTDKYYPQYEYKEIEEVGLRTLPRKYVLLNEDNMEALKEKAIEDYTKRCQFFLIFTALGFGILWFLKKWLKRKFIESK